MLKKTLLLLLLGIGMLLSILVINWLRMPVVSHEAEPVVSLFHNSKDVAETLSKTIQIPSISHRDSSKDNIKLTHQLKQYLADRFPEVHKSLQLKSIGEHALLYTWQGTNTALKPNMLVAHFDVVPSEASTWNHPPFSGHMDEKFVWGRGAMDDKAAIISILHAVSALLESGFQPQRTLLLAFGGDEEVGGRSGAAKISQFLQDQKIELEYILDEGMPITDGIMKGIDKPVAMIGIAEKGSMTVKLTTRAIAGHASTPPKETAVGILAKAIAQLETNPMPARIPEPIELLFDTLAPDMRPLQGIVVSNRWLTSPLLKWQLAKQNATNALINTTMATTMIQGSQQENVLPKTATATVNIRLLPGDTIDNVLSHIKQVIDTSEVSIEVMKGAINPSSVSSTQNAAYHTVTKSIRQVFPVVIPAPSLLIAGSDSKHYTQLSDSIYRFRPVWVKKEDINRFHGANERIAIENLNNMAMFFYQLIVNSNN